MFQYDDAGTVRRGVRPALASLGGMAQESVCVPPSFFFQPRRSPSPPVRPDATLVVTVTCGVRCPPLFPTTLGQSMALPSVADLSVIQAVFRATITGNDGAQNPLENVQWFQYFRGFGPDPLGIPINDMAFRALGRWASFWRAFQSADAFFFSCTLRLVNNFVSTGGSKYSAVLLSQWTDNTSQAVGAVVSPSLPSFNAFAIRKLTATPGRGHQGQIRIPGVPQSSQADNAIVPLVLAALDAALTPTSLNLNVSTGMAFSDILQPCIINGKAINLAPGNPPQFYVQLIEGFTATEVLASQVTRKTGRHRS